MLDSSAPRANEVKCKRLYKERWDKADLVQYYFQSGQLLQSIDAPLDLLQCTSGCKCDIHKASINRYYNNIVCMLKRATSGCVPKMPYNCLKSFWNDDLDRLKTISIDMHNLWRQCGSPRQGITNTARLKAKTDYKQAIRKTSNDYERTNADEINGHFLKRDLKNFWKCWNTKYQKSLSNAVTISGQTEPDKIANTFKESYAKVYVDSYINSVSVIEFNDLFNLLDNSIDVDVAPIDIESIERCIMQLKSSK